jgi:hypothetical protein
VESGEHSAIDSLGSSVSASADDLSSDSESLAAERPCATIAEVLMQKKLTITVDERVYAGLQTIVGRRRISQFIESLVRPYVIGKDLEAAYHRMAQEEAREAEALEWAEATMGDVADEPR